MRFSFVILVVGGVVHQQLYSRWHCAVTIEREVRAEKIFQLEFVAVYGINVFL